MSVCGNSTSCSSSSVSSACKPLQKICKKQDYTERNIYKLIRPTASGLLLTDTKIGGNLTLTGALNIGNETISSTQLGYLTGLTSNIQTQINNIGTGSTSGNLNGLSDALVENNSIYLGSDPNGTTDNANFNVAVGIEALDSITTGDSNVAVGYQALTSNTTGISNAASGAYSLVSNTTGEYNTASGAISLFSNTTGNYNSASGHKSLGANTTGNNNTASGSGSLTANTTGKSNTASGFFSLFSNTSGCFNIGLGQSAGKSLATGNYNVMIGYETQPSSSNAENQIVIGKSATGQANNSVTLGNADVTAVYMAQDSGATVYCGGLNIGGTEILIEGNSLYLGSNPVSTTDNANFNLAVGINALDSITTGDSNIAVGYNTLTNNTMGYNNTAFGYEAGNVITTGSNNVILGYQADPSTLDAENQIVIGKGATGVANNSVTLGNADVTAVYMAQDSGATVYCAGLNIGGVSITASGAEINYLDGVTSNIQTQINDLSEGVESAINNISGGASSINDLTDALIESDSIYLGSDPNATTLGANYNVAVGINALDSITSGDRNVAIGYDALTVNTSGKFNTALGAHSLIVNSTGNSNTALGSFSLYNSTTGSFNTAVGASSLYNNTGASNTALGYFSLYNNTGDNNTAFGREAGELITTGSNNVIIGYQADPGTNTAENQIVIGKGATGQGDNYAVIGNADITRLYAAQDGAAVLYADATIQSSDRRLKKDISDTTLGLSFINELNPVSYKWINEKRRGSETHFGLIAQEVDEIMNKLNMPKEAHAVVQYDEKEDKYGISYNELICPLIKSVQELSTENNQLKEQVSSMSYYELIDPLIKSVKELTTENNKLKSQLASVISRLDALENK